MHDIKEKDTWIVVGPGRTGSFLITLGISAVYSFNDIQLQWLTSTKELPKKSSGIIVHTHESDCQKIRSANYILSYRDPCETVLSKIIAERTKVFHYWSNDQLKVRLKPFYLDPIDFLLYHGHVLNWYRLFYNQNIKNVKLVPDGNAYFTRSMGMLVNKSNLGFGERSWRYAAVVDKGIIEKLFIESGKRDNVDAMPTIERK